MAGTTGTTVAAPSPAVCCSMRPARANTGSRSGRDRAALEPGQRLFVAGAHFRVGWGEADDDEEVVFLGFDDQQALGDIELLLGEQAGLAGVEDAEVERGADAVAVGGRVDHRAGAAV